jgi:hypothetical protein
MTIDDGTVTEFSSSQATADVNAEEFKGFRSSFIVHESHKTTNHSTAGVIHGPLNFLDQVDQPKAWQ